MEFYGSQSEIIDEATLKKQTINYIDLNFSELKKTIELPQTLTVLEKI